MSHYNKSMTINTYSNRKDRTIETPTQRLKRLDRITVEMNYRDAQLFIGAIDGARDAILDQLREDDDVYNRVLLAIDNAVEKRMRADL